MTFPKSISPCPILDALFEVRFSSNINSNAVFGQIYGALQKDFPKVESLPILQLPDSLRNTDPNFQYKPHYRISNENFVVQIGPDVIAISSFPNYAGWEAFSKKIFSILEQIENIKIINKVERVGIRYINFFENDIFQNITLKVCIGNETVTNKNTVVRTEIEEGEFSSTLQIANNAINNDVVGSIIDIDTFRTINLSNFFIDKEEIINNGHSTEKNIFYSLLQPNFLSTLNPTL